MKKVFILFLFLMFFPKSYGIIDEDGPLTKKLKWLNEKFSNATGLNTLEYIKDIRDFASIIGEAGVVKSQVIAKILDIGISKLEGDEKEAALIEYNKTTDRHNFDVQQRNEILKKLIGILAKIFYRQTITHNLNNLKNTYFECISPFSWKPHCHDTFTIKCINSDPLNILESIYSGVKTDCKIPTQQSYAKYVFYKNEIELLENDIIFTDENQKQALLEAKIQLYSNVLHETFSDYHLDTSIQELQQMPNLTADILIAMLHRRSWTESLCFLEAAYLAHNESREVLIQEARIIATDLVHARDYFYACFGFKDKEDWRYVKGTFFVRESADAILTYINGILRHAWPSSFNATANNFLPTIKLPADKFNETAENILKALDPKGHEDFNYIVFISDITNNSTSVSTYSNCSLSYNCITSTKGGIRYFIFRYQVSLAGELEYNHADSWWSAARATLVDVVDKNRKIVNLEELLKKIFQRVGTIPFKKFLLLHDSHFEEKDTQINVGFAADKLGENNPIKSIYNFFHYPFSPLPPYPNDEVFFLFFFN